MYGSVFFSNVALMFLEFFDCDQNRPRVGLTPSLSKHTWRLASIKTVCAWRLPSKTALDPRTFMQKKGAFKQGKCHCSKAIWAKYPNLLGLTRKDGYYYHKIPFQKKTKHYVEVCDIQVVCANINLFLLKEIRGALLHGNHSQISWKPSLISIYFSR